MSTEKTGEGCATRQQLINSVKALPDNQGNPAYNEYKKRLVKLFETRAKVI